MLLRPARIALHAAVATLLAGGAVLVAGAPGHADTSVRPESYGGDATASSIHFMADRKPQPTPVSDAFHLELPYATTSLDASGTASATSSSAYPGAGPLGVPALLCQFEARLCSAPFPAVPRFPLIATASYPTKPDDKADTSPEPQALGPVTVSPNVSVAHADQSRVESTAKAAGLGVSGVMTADSATATSKQAFEGSTLVLTAVSTISGLDIGGQLHLDALRSVATARVDGGKVSSSSATTTITGASAGGVPVTLDSTGIHLAGNGDDGAAREGLNTALAALDASGITVRLLRDSKVARTGTVSAATGGLLLSFVQAVDVPLPAPPPLPIPLPAAPPDPDGEYFGSLTLGGAGVTAFATPPYALTPPDVQLPGTTVVPPASAPLPEAVLTPPIAAGQPQPPVLAGRTPVLSPRHQAAVLGLDLTAERLKLLVLVLLGYPLLVLLAAPLRAPARLPRAG